MSFAEGTTVSVARSREELQRLLEAAGVSQFGTAHETSGSARIAFKLNGLLCHFEVPAVDVEALAKKLKVRTRWYRGREISAAEQLVEKVNGEKRRRWRALVLVTKAKLEAIASGISTLESEFLAHVVMRDGRQLVDALRPQLQEYVRSGDVPNLLGPGA